MRVRKLFEIPQPSTAAVADPTFHQGQDGVWIAIECYDLGEPLVRSTIKVHSCRAFRKLAELYCKVWHNQAYDTVCEVEESAWVEELRQATPGGYDYKWVLKHFMLYLDSVGCYEFVAESVTIENTVLDETLNE